MEELVSSNILLTDKPKKIMLLGPIVFSSFLIIASKLWNGLLILVWDEFNLRGGFVHAPLLTAWILFPLLQVCQRLPRRRPRPTTSLLSFIFNGACMYTYIYTYYILPISQWIFQFPILVYFFRYLWLPSFSLWNLPPESSLGPGRGFFFSTFNYSKSRVFNSL